MSLRGKQKNRQSVTGQRMWPFITAFSLFIIAIVLRLPYLSHGLDQYDVVLYKNSLVHMHFFREVQWPLLLLFQKGLWLLAPHLSAAQILSLTNILLGAATISIFFLLAYQLTKSYLVGLALSTILFISPLFSVYSVVGMQDMAQTFAMTIFVACLLQYCRKKTDRWLYLSSTIAGLAIGVRATLVLALPALAVAALLTLGFKHFRIYLKACAYFLIGVLIWFIPERFIPPLAGTSPLHFFLLQYRAYNPAVLGYVSKAGSYALLTGYTVKLFLWLPVVGFLIYLLAHRKRTNGSLGPLLILVGTFASLMVSNGVYLNIVSQNTHRIFLTGTLIIIACASYEIFSFWPHKNKYFRKIDTTEKTILSLGVLVIGFVAFEYISTQAVARYLLPIIPTVFLLIVLNLESQKWRQLVTIGLIGGLLLLACPPSRAQGYIATFKKTDPRSLVAMYVGSHPGRYYDVEATDTEITYLQSYGVDDNVQTVKVIDCSKLKTNQNNFAIFYGEASKQSANCDQYSFIKLANFNRQENVIEDSVGNVGFNVYRIAPTE